MELSMIEKVKLAKSLQENPERDYMQNFMVNNFLTIQEYVIEANDPEDFKDWSVEKIVNLVYGKEEK